MPATSGSSGTDWRHPGQLAVQNRRTQQVDDLGAVEARMQQVFSREITHLIAHHFDALLVEPVFGAVQQHREVELLLDAGTRSQVIEAVNLFRAKVIDVSTESLTIEATGTPEKLEALLRVLEPYGIREIVQSGVVALSRGPRGMTAGK